MAAKNVSHQERRVSPAGRACVVEAAAASRVSIGAVTRRTRTDVSFSPLISFWAGNSGFNLYLN